MDDELVTVDVVTVEPAGPRSTVAVGVGTTPDGRWVTFAGGTREMLRIAAELDAGAPRVAAVVPTWAVLTTSPEPAP